MSADHDGRLPLTLFDKLGSNMETALSIPPRRAHLTRLMTIWRSAGWPCCDAIELDLIAAGWATLVSSDGGRDCMRLTDTGIRLLADAKQRNRRCLSAHDRLAQRVAEHLVAMGRIVWRELALRAQVVGHDASAADVDPRVGNALWPVDPTERAAAHHPGGATSWRMARPDVFSVRHTSVEAYLQPMVHEIKVSRADLLSDLRHTAKRESYQWLSCETCYVFPAGMAEPHEIPAAFGVWVLHGAIDGGTFDIVRPAVHTLCKLPFAVWKALAKASPVRLDGEPAQRQLGEAADCASPPSDAALNGPTAAPISSPTRA